MIDPLHEREQLMQRLLADSELGRQELGAALDGGDAYLVQACLHRANRRATSDIRLGWRLLRNGVAGVWRYLRASWIVGWRRGWRGGR